ncbi:hypothetical protein NLI96_g3011 [Meripilus lineatus]|uniref:Uncharacterized protein n=1 Tax=Meripilus lineatus TaxID=2056292 RepID=A0AAD5V9N5_9APHY|nr:hypothetical protein NLI96_g3011 [Physisporinus lineatus]
MTSISVSNSVFLLYHGSGRESGDLQDMPCSPQEFSFTWDVSMEMLSSLCSSGSIPIILHSGIEASGSHGSLVSATIPSDVSNNTINTIGTFGPRRHMDNRVAKTAESPTCGDDSFGCVTPRKQDYPNGVLLSPHEGRPNISPFRGGPDLSSPSSPLMSSGEPVFFSFPYDSLICITSTGKESAGDSTPGRTRPSLQLCIPPASPSGTLEPRPAVWTELMGDTMGELSRNDWPETSHWSHDDMRKNLPSARTLPGSPTPRQRKDPNRIPTSHVHANPKPVLPSDLPTTSPSNIPPPTNRRLKVPQLPDALSWLQTSVVKLWIDQEGFRSVRAILKLAGFSNISTVHGHEVTPTPNNGDEITSALSCGRVDFRPAKRQSFVFHHGTLDGLPALRQLTLLGDDTKDFISRQASLTLKPNGVYSVSGIETFDAIAAGHLQSSSKLFWRFEYLVDDLRDKRGKIVSGEKTVTPLGFSCSPGLLHPSRGKKTKMMHLFKKAITFKLPSERMEAPKPPKDYIPPPPSPFGHPRPNNGPLTDVEIPEEIQSTQPTDAKPTTLVHRRARSSIDHPTTSLTACASIPPAGSEPSPDISHPQRNRPASINGLNDFAGKPQSHQSRDRPYHYPHLTERRRSLTAPTLKVVRHILPPSELSELISNHATEAPSQSPLTSPSSPGPTSLRPPTYRAKGGYF